VEKIISITRAVLSKYPGHDIASSFKTKKGGNSPAKEKAESRGSFDKASSHSCRQSLTPFRFWAARLPFQLPRQKEESITNHSPTRMRQPVAFSQVWRNIGALIRRSATFRM
jgi:hypothetical protein